jgi:hypothetical protein
MDATTITIFVGIIVIMAMVFNYRERGLRRAFDVMWADRNMVSEARLGTVADVAHLRKENAQLKRRISKLETQLEVTYDELTAITHSLDEAELQIELLSAPLYESYPRPNPEDIDLMGEPAPEPPWEAVELEREFNNDLPPAGVDPDLYYEVNSPAKWWMTQERPTSWTTPEEREAHDKVWVIKTKDARKKEWAEMYG